MPVPIRMIEDKAKGAEDGLIMDYSILQQSYNSFSVGGDKNANAKVLYELWSSAERSEKTPNMLKKSEAFNKGEISMLRAAGLIEDRGDKIRITDKGQEIITVMCLSEASSFEDKRQRKSYTEILASMPKRGKPGYRIPKMACTQNNLNLRKNG